MAALRLDRAAVVAAAGRVADSDGLEAVTLARLARELGVRPPSLYNHVPSHTELLRLLATSSVEGLGTAIRDAAVGRSRGDALRAIAVAFRDYAHKHPGCYSATVRAPGADEPEKEAAAADAVDPILAVLAGWSLEGDEAVHQVRVIRSALHGFALLEIGGGFGLPLDLDTTFERLVQTLEAGIRSAAGENP